MPAKKDPERLEECDAGIDNKVVEMLKNNFPLTDTSFPPPEQECGHKPATV
jgi:hypothetical protein